jgi:flagellar basal body-associated protein FliL
MADLVEDVTEEEEETEEVEEKAGFFTLPKIVLIAALVVVLGGGGFVGMKVMGSGEEKRPDPVVYSFEKKFIVNVRGTSGTRTVMCDVALKLESADMLAQFQPDEDGTNKESRNIEFRDLIVRILQRYEIQDLDFVGQNKIRRDIEDEFNLILDNGKVLQVYFPEFLIR